MTKEELEKEAEECMHNALFWLKLPISKENVEQGGSYILKLLEPREKQIQIDAKQIRALQKQNGELTDELTKKANTNHQLIEQMAELNERCSELEAQIEKMKCCGNCKHYKFQNDARYYTCVKDGKRNGKNYRSCEFNLEKWEGR